MCLALLGAPAPSAAQGMKLMMPSSANDGAVSAGWEPLYFKKVERRTVYEWSARDGVLHATSSAAASGLIYRLDRQASAAPLLRWRWRISGTIVGGDERSKRGDDYAARIYVTFKYEPSKVGAATRLKYGLARRLLGEYPPHSGINYIWANRLPKGESVPNAYTDRVRMLAVRSGDSEAGRWMREERNIVDDYRTLYGEEPPPLAGIAIMTDTDDTAGRAEAWYADVELMNP